MKITLLIIGSMGFVANAFIRSLFSKNAKRTDHIYEIIGIDNLSYDSSIINKFVNKDFKFYVADIKDKNNLEKIFRLHTDIKNNKKIDVILYLADGAKESDLILDPSYHIYNNNCGMQNVLDLSVKYNVGKFLYTSSYKVYGKNQKTNSIETDNLEYSNLYTMSKIMSEKQVELTSREYGISYNILRLCNVIGSRQRSNFLIPKAINNIIKDIPVLLENNGDELREWLPIEDLVDALKLMIEDNNHKNEIYNISANYELSLLEIVNKLYSLLDKKMNIKYSTNKIIETRYAVNSDKIKSIGWIPQIKFKESLENTVTWYKSNMWWFDENNI